MTKVCRGSRHHHTHGYGAQHEDYNESARLAVAKAKARKLGKNVFDFENEPYILVGNEYVAWHSLKVGKDIMKQNVIRATQSPLNKRQWLCELECGHEQWVTANRRPVKVECISELDCHAIKSTPVQRQSQLADNESQHK